MASAAVQSIIQHSMFKEQHEKPVNWCKHPLTDYFGPPNTLNVSRASDRSGDDLFRQTTSYVGPKDWQGMWNDFNTLLNIYGGKNEYLSVTVYEAILDRDNVVTQQIFPWKETTERIFSFKIAEVEPTLAVPSGPQTSARGISVGWKDYSVETREFRNSFEVDGQFYDHSDGKVDFALKSRSLVASFLYVADNLGISLIMNHDKISRVFQPTFGKNLNIAWNQLYARRNDTAFATQKNGYQGLVTTTDEMSILVKNPNVWLVPRGFSTLLANIPNDSIFFLVGLQRMEDNLLVGTPSKKSIRGIRIHQYVPPPVMDTDAPTEHTGTLQSERAFNGVAYNLHNSKFSNDEFTNDRRTMALLDMDTNGVLILTLKDLIQRSLMFGPDGELNPKLWELKNRFNDTNLNKQYTPSFKKSSMMLFWNEDIKKRLEIAGNNNDGNIPAWDIARYIGEAVQKDHLLEMIQVALNLILKQNRNFLEELSQLKRLSQDLSTVSNASEKDFVAINEAAALQAGKSKGGLVLNAYGTLDLPYFEDVENEPNKARIYFNFEGKKFYLAKNFATAGRKDEENMLDSEDTTGAKLADTYTLDKENISANGFGTPGGIMTLAELNNSDENTNARRMLPNSLIERASKASDFIAFFTAFLHELFPNSLLFKNKSETEKMLAVGQLLLGPQISYAIKTTSLPFDKVDEGGNPILLTALNPFKTPIKAQTNNKKIYALQSPLTWEEFKKWYASSSPLKEARNLKGKGAFNDYFTNFVVTVRPDLKAKAIILALDKSPRGNLSTLDNNSFVTFLEAYDTKNAVIDQNYLRIISGYVDTTLYLTLSSFKNVVLDDKAILRPRNKEGALIANRIALEGILQKRSDANITDIELLGIFEKDASFRINITDNEMSTGGVIEYGKYLSSHLKNLLKEVLTSGLNSASNAIFILLATLPNQQDSWLNFVPKIPVPADFKIIRPARIYVVSSGALMNTNGLGNTMVIAKDSNTVIGRDVTGRFYKIDSIMTMSPVLLKPEQIQRQDLLRCDEYKTGEGAEFFTEENPFDPNVVQQSASNMCIMGPVGSMKALDFVPMTGFFSPATFASSQSKNHFGLKMNEPYHGSAPFYNMIFGMELLDPPVIPDMIVGQNKDNLLLDQIGSRMWCAKYNPVTQKFDNLDIITDEFGEKGSYVGCATDRNGGIFAGRGAVGRTLNL